MAAAPLSRQEGPASRAHVQGTTSCRQVRPPLAVRKSASVPVLDVLTIQPAWEFAKWTTGAVGSS